MCLVDRAIPTTAPRQCSRARKVAAPQPKAVSQTAGWVATSEIRAATRGVGEVIELDLRITVYPPRQDGGRRRAVWYEDGEWRSH